METIRNKHLFKSKITQWIFNYVNWMSFISTNNFKKLLTYIRDLKWIILIAYNIPVV